jgi:hypothetical protein
MMFGWDHHELTITPHVALHNTPLPEDISLPKSSAKPTLGDWGLATKKKK